MSCWHCKTRIPIQYKEDPHGTLRCPGCGELEMDNPKIVKGMPETSFDITKVKDSIIEIMPPAKKAAAKRTAARSK